MESLDVVGPYDVFAMSNLSGVAGFNLITVGEKAEPVTSIGGLTLRRSA